ncbi:3-hydroxyacyl-CoA dehydrogenase family protein [Ferroplasma acidiphilum]|uniref:3-hydroxyacyl-CoA dehydrogenase family protein n=1 Tax=Ferroplasma acidiphilum TaxID=74969 RepID=UPI0023F53820|nr:3-hydroxyacyl-CoA dehydrogenase family protein [Ferroplasma acidiphilum]WMT53590.1 MAG: 3-hydroxyacyl-CoA dehydrogenase family protein [Ferroplasma acidiphilum]
MIEKIGIIGAGAMGSSIAEVFAFNGYSVYLKDQNMEYVNRGISHVRKVLDDYQSYMDSMPDKEIKRIERNGIELTETQKNTIKKNLGKQLDIDGIISNIHPVESYKELSQCGLVIEAVFEKQEIKNDLFRELSGYFGENTILASNTSSLSITEMAANYKYPENNIIIHFFNPPYTMPLVEIVPALQTGSKTVETAYSLISGLRNHRDAMVPVKAKERSGFIVNRILIQLINEAIKIVEEGIADEKSVDIGMKKGAGFPMGPFELGDYVGLDIVYDVLKSFNKAYGDAYIPPERLKNMVIAGYLGRKTGKGFYEYGK